MMTNKSKVSIIIVNCDGGRHILNCLKSVKKSTYPNYEIIVVDNGSRDGSPDLIKKNFPDVKLILNKKNIGFTGGNNVGMKNAKGDIYFLLNDDTVIRPDLIKILVKELESSPKIGIVGPKIYFMDEPGKIWFAGGKIDWSKSKTFHIGRNLKDKELVYDFKRETDFITGCALMIKKEVVDKIGLLDKSFFIYYEDADWSQKAKKAGYKVIYIPFGGVWHIKSATTSRVFLDDLRNQLKKAKTIKKIRIYFKIAWRYLLGASRWEYRSYRNQFIFFIRQAPLKYKIIFLIKFVFIFTPQFLWAVIYQIPLSLFKIVLKHKN